MGIYYKKLMESAAVEKAVEDAIQTPDDVGVDLDAIEDAIVGKDGNEAHREEIDAAEEGVVGDPLEECAVIMYESEYNFNQLMKCIGIAELNEFAAGKDFILEGANLSAFFDKARELFTNMFKRFTELFSKAVAKISDKMNVDKNLVRKHEKEMREGFGKDSWKFENAYEFDKLNVSYEPRTSELMNLWDKAIDDVKDNSEGLQADRGHLSHVECVKRVSGKTVSDEGKAAGEMVAQLKADAFVKTNFASGAEASLLNTVVDILKSDSDVKALRASYKAIKDDYSRIMKWLKECQNMFKGDANEEHIKSTCLAYTKALQYEKNLQHSYFSVCLNAHTTRRSQARRMAMTWVRMGGGEAKEGKPAEPEKPKALGDGTKHENAFLNFAII